MKISKVIPVLKAGDNSKSNNYRPIALLLQFSKIPEKLFKKRLDSFLKKLNIINERQYGSIQGRSRAMAITDLVESIIDATDKKMSTIGVYIDLRKAFDTINHKILVKKQEHYGIRGISSNNMYTVVYLTNLLIPCLYTGNKRFDLIFLKEEKKSLC